MINKIADLLEKVRNEKPLIHHITNYVTVNDCANICLAIGASPIMADDISEAADIAAISKCLVLNIGTLNRRTVASMVEAGIRANECGIPVVLDPVGAGASKFRNETAALLLEKIKFSVVRGNLSEIRFLVQNSSNTKGVDVSSDDMNENGVDIARQCAQKLGCVAAITGKIDVISDGSHTICIENGHERLSGITGTGCMCTTLIGSFCGSNSDMLLCAAGGILSMGIAGELAFEESGCKGLGSFRVSIIDEISGLDRQTLTGRAKIYEAVG